MYGRGRSRGGGRASEQSTSSTRSGAAKLKEEKKEEAVGKGKNGAGAAAKKGKNAGASPAPPLNRASSRSPGRGGGAGGQAGSQGSGAGPPSRARSLPTPRGKPPPPTPRGARTSKGKTVESPPAPAVEAADSAAEQEESGEVGVAQTSDENADTKLDAEVEDKAATKTASPGETGKPTTPVRERKRLKRPILNDNPEAPEVVDVPNMKSSLGLENEDISNSAQDPDSLLVKPGKVREKRTLKGSQKMPSVAERDSPLSVRVNSDERVNSTSSAPHSPLKPVAQVSPFRSMPQSPCKGANNSLTLNVKDIVGGLVNTAACLADSVGEANGDCEGEEKDLSESDILTRMIRENLNKAVTAGTPDEMKKSLNDAIKNTFRNRSSNSNSSVASTPTDEKPVTKTDKSDSNVLGEIVVNGNVLNGDKEKGLGAEKENKNELMESSDISDGLISHIVETLTDAGSEKIQPKKDGEVDDQVKDTKKSLNSTSKSAITVLPAMVSVPAPALMSSDGITDLPGDQNNSESSTITLDQLDQGMVPVGSVQIEQIEADGTTINVNSPSFSVVVMEEEEKPKLNIDKTKLFSQMNDIFAKDTHNALKHRPVYQKRTRQSPEDSKEVLSSPSKKKLKVKEAKVEKSPKAKTNLLAELENSEPKMEEEEEDKPDTVADEELVEVKEMILQKDAEMKDAEEEVAAESIEEENDSMMNNNVPDLSNGDNDASKHTQEPSVEVSKAAGTEDDDEEEVDEGEAEEDVDEDDEEEDDDVDEEPEVDLDAPENDKHPAAEVDLDEPKEEEEDEKKCDITESPDLDESPKLPREEDLPPMQVSSSELTKSLRQVRLNKKTSVKSPLKEKWQPRNETPELDKEEEEEIDDDEEEEEEEIDDDEEEEVGPPDSPHLPNLSASGAKGTEVFDFTDDEDIPLSNIDIAALNAAGPEADTPHATLPAASSPVAQLTPRPSPTKTVARRLVQQDVSPQVLTAMDAIAAVQALQQSPPASRQDLPVVKLNGDVMSDDTDNSVGLKALLSVEKSKSTKRKKRRVPDSDEAETDDDLEGNKKATRPKRVKNLSGPPPATPSEGSSTPAPSTSQTRPASAASVASTASASDKRDIEDVKAEEKQEDKGEAKHEDKADESNDGKQTPDSQKSLSLDKESSKTLSTVVPEKASSFTIHPDRVCSDMCFYCGLKFGMLDTPLHIAQLKTLEKQEFAMEYTGFVRDVCLCDRCFRFLDRRAASKDMNGAKTLQQAAEPKEEKVKKCLVRTCNRQVTSKVSKRWLIRLKKRLVKKVGLDWDKVSKASVKAEFPFCSKHTNLIDFYTNCGLCRRKLTIQGICPLGMTTKEVEEMNILLREDHIPADLKENNFVCKLCKTFCGIKQKSLQPDYLKNHKTHKAFYKDYRRKLYIYLELGEDEKTEGKLTKKLFKVSQSDSGSCKITIRRDVTPEAGGDRKKKPREPRELLSPSDESRLQVVGETKDKEAELVEKCSVNINFDLHTKKLWQDLHYPYGSYTSFFRHLILLERYWRAGDISLAEDASPKANAYIKSVQNRIKAYDQGRNTDLSASTRPDLETPAAPTLSHTPGEAVLANLPNDGSRTPELRSPESTILRIPKVPQPRVSPSLTSPEPSTVSNDLTSSPGPKIRVRQDLMAHLGLVAKNSANIVQQPPPKTTSSALTVTSTSTCSTPNLSKLLSETGPPVVPSQAESRGAISIAPAKKSSNSQLFKSTESTGAIPLTFNNSIAEVLAAANKAKSARSREPSPKPEITITAKSSQGKSKAADQPPHLLNLYSSKSSKLEIGPSKPSAIATSPSPSGGGLSILKRSLATTSTPSSTTVNPLSNMHKLLQTQAPGLPPHIIAQQALPARPSPKVLGKPPGGPRPSTPTIAITPTSNKPSGIQTVNKKSLNTVLDRLGGLSTTASPTMSKSPSLSSSLVQQLQAPPMTSRPGGKQGTKSQVTNKTQSQLQKALGGNSNTSSGNSGMAQYPNMFPGGLDPSALMSMIPPSNPSLLSQSLLGFNQPNAAAAQAALMMAGMTGMSGQQAQQAMQELLQQQGQLMAAAQQQQQQQQKQSTGQQMRAPPPLKHMSGGRGPNLGAKQD